MDIRRIDTFGKVAAENDAILDYFLITETTRSIESGTHLIVVGEKARPRPHGCYYSERTPPGLLSRAIRMTDYPWGRACPAPRCRRRRDRRVYRGLQYLLGIDITDAVTEVVDLVDLTSGG